MSSSENPALRMFMESMNTAPPLSSPPAPPLDLSLDPDLSSDQSTEFSFASTAPAPVPNPAAGLILMEPVALQAFGNFVRGLKKDFWSPAQMKEWDGFIGAVSLEERLGIHVVNTLDMKELLSQALKTKEGDWSPSSNTRVVVKAYSLAHLLSHSLTAYSGTNNHSLVIEHMRANGVDCIPPASNAVAKKALDSFVKQILTDMRSYIKEKLKKSIAEKWDLGTLVKSVLGSGNSQVAPTVKLYCRLACLRWHLDNTTFNEDKWWVDGPDATLKVWRQKGDVFLNACFTKMFEGDLAKYGALEESPAEPQTDTWTKMVDKFAAKVTPKASTTERTAIKRKRTGEPTRKRRRTDLGEEDDEDDDNGEGDATGSAS